MIANRNKLYKLILLACLVGYVWVYLNLIQVVNTQNHFEVCFIKRVLNIPCPSCGTTRSIAAILSGDLKMALYLNPFGFLISIILLICPIWIIKDVFFKKQSFLNFYKLIEQKINKPFYTIMLVSLVLINWIWNFTKEL